MKREAWSRSVAVCMLIAAGAGMIGCAPGASPSPCRPGAEAAGRICAGGIDFGANPDPLYREGVRDGCRTGQGYFSKNYRLSGSSESYRLGWEKGRSLCRPAGWSDTPTYSYHPLPDRYAATNDDSRESRYFTASERIRRYTGEE